MISYCVSAPAWVVFVPFAFLLIVYLVFSR